jgi:hypothetical protein
MSRLSRETWSTTTYPDAPGYQKHSATSKAAADSIRPKALGDLHRKVWAHIRDSGGCTDEAGQEALGLAPNTYRPRRRELELAGYVGESGRTALTHSGRSASIWVVTAKGRAG